MNMHAVYANTARFDAPKALTEDQMRKIAPSIFAVEAHDSRSDRFEAIPTIEILRGLINEGFAPVGVKQSGTRDASRAAFTKHLIRMRRIDDDRTYSVGDTVCEILLKNANDGTSAYELMAGLFRIRCLNSLVAQVGTLESTKVRHTGDVQGKVIEGTYTVLNQARAALAAPADWSQIKLDRDQRQIFAEAAHELRFSDAEGTITTPVEPSQLLVPRRSGDRDQDLWTTFNVLQENTIRGGVRATGRDANGNRRRVTTREVKGIDQDVKLNRALWKLTERMAELTR